MPGLKQLKQLSSDVLSLGDEVKVRAARGEKPAVAELSSDIPDIDDSNDFVLGLPEQAAKADAGETSESPSEAETQSESEKTADTGDAADTSSVMPDLNDILNGAVGDGEPDLSDFMKSEPAKPEEPSIADLDLDALLNSGAPSEPAKTAKPQPQKKAPPVVPAKEETVEDIPEAEAVEDEEAPVPEKSDNDDFDVSGQDQIIDMNQGLPEELTKEDSSLKVPDSEQPASVPEDTGFELETPETKTGQEPQEQDSFETPDTSAVSDQPVEEPPAEDQFEMPDAAGSVPEMPSTGDAFEVPDTSGVPDQPVEEPSETEQPSESADAAGEVQTEPQSPAEMPDLDETAQIPDIDDELAASASADKETQTAPAAESSDETKAADVSLPDFDFPETDKKIGPETGGFELSSPEDFEIPGFSNTDEETPGTESVEAPDFSKAPKVETKSSKNSLTEEEYKTFKKNLAGYPLNVRVAIEDLIVKNEFTDDAVFEVIDKVLKKVSARQLATHLEKMLDITLNVPRDYERRSFAEYEAYKASLQYQLRNRIIPGLLISVGAVLVCIWLFMVGKYFIYRPLKANDLYKQGYELLQADEYPQADMKFNQALSYKISKPWFYKYARAYRAHKQYSRAEDMYTRILATFDFDKQAGLEYANMELMDLVNYERAETVDRRFVLDHYINDKDGLLLLGDIFLEWATEKDPAKFEQAREQYASLIQLYGQKDLYLGRMMRYFIRTDNLREVLKLKEHFLPKSKALGSQDLTELGGYMLEKEYGTLAPTDEYLRTLIEDVRTILERAVKADPANPEALYNMSCYFVKAANTSAAITYLKRTADAFGKAPVLNKRNVYKQIDTYRQLGELYGGDREYIKASESYSSGIEVFKKKQEESGLEGNAGVGKLYEDMADINYYISGDFDGAYADYQSSLKNSNDNPFIRYHLGVIDYSRNAYDEALGSFIKASETLHGDNNLLFAMGNVLSMKNDNYAAQGYYDELLNHLDMIKQRKNILFPQVRDDDTETVELYMKSANNLGVTLYRLARQTGNSAKNAEALVRLTDSLRAWDALTRNQTTMVRLGGSNLAEQNIKYMSHPQPDYEPAIYTDIPVKLMDEKGLK